MSEARPSHSPAGSLTCPTVTVAIPTRGRPHDLARCLQSLVAVDYPSWDVLVVDQSDDPHTKQLCEGFTARLPGFRYCHMTGKGASRARNLALQASSAEILAFLDDDCTVDVGWLRQVAEVLARHPSAAIVVGTVRAIPHDPQTVFVPSSVVVRETVLRGRLAALFLRRAGTDVEIMSASMYVRRALAAPAGPFDVYLGPGARFGIAEDTEYAYRVLRTGRSIVMTPSVEVLHYGGRAYQGGAVSRMFHTVAYAIGAVDMKLLRCGEWPALVLIPAHALQYLRWIQPGNFLRRHGPTGLAWISWYIKGLFASFQLQTDRRRLLYVSDTDRQVDVPGGDQPGA